MKKFLIISIAFLIGFLAVLSLNLKISLAQETETMSFSYGTVLRISSDQIVISEYDYDKDEESEAAYRIDGETEFKNVKAAADVVVGDSADIVYVVSNGQRVAHSISIEKQADDEENGSEENDIEPIQGNSPSPSAVITENRI